MSHPPSVALEYQVRGRLDDWVLSDRKVSQAIPHTSAAVHLLDALTAQAARTGSSAVVALDLAVRWDGENRGYGIDPDVCVLEPPPPEGRQLTALCYWREGHLPPTICFEIVSKNHPHKDYAGIQDRYAMTRTRELAVFDPGGYGPRRFGGPLLLQLWRVSPAGVLERVHAGSSPAWSEQLKAWLHPHEAIDGEPRLLLCNDEEGRQPWLTEAEHERAGKEHERVEKERERTAKEHERVEKERERTAKEHERAEKERERTAKEHERAEKERLEQEVLELRRRLESGRS